MLPTASHRSTRSSRSCCAGVFSQPASQPLKPKVIGSPCRHGSRTNHHRVLVAPATHADRHQTSSSCVQAVTEAFSLQGQPVVAHRKLVINSDVDVAARVLRRCSLTLVRKGKSRRTAHLRFTFTVGHPAQGSKRGRWAGSPPALQPEHRPQPHTGLHRP